MSVYKFKTNEKECLKPIVLPARKLKEPYKYKDQAGKVWLTINPDGTWEIEPGYAWDGCSPKKVWFNQIVGTWDGPIYAPEGAQVARIPSLLHDAGYQALSKDRAFPFSRKMVDQIFYHELTKRQFILAKPYYVMVRIFGGLNLKLDACRERLKKRKL